MSRVDELIAAGFEQVSRKYRTLARLPPGTKGLEALREHNASRAREIMEKANDEAARLYRAVYASGEDKIELSEEEFKEYLKKTGRAPVLR